MRAPGLGPLRAGRVNACVSILLRVVVGTDLLRERGEQRASSVSIEAHRVESGTTSPPRWRPHRSADVLRRGWPWLVLVPALGTVQLFAHFAESGWARRLSHAELHPRPDRLACRPRRR